MVAPCSLAQPIRRVSACKGCCLAPGNLEEGWPNTRKEAPQRHKPHSYSVLSLKFEPNVQLMLVACGTQCFTEPMPGSLTMQASSARIASLDTRSSSRVPIDWTLLETYEKRIRNVFNAFLSCTSSPIISNHLHSLQHHLFVPLGSTGDIDERFILHHCDGGGTARMPCCQRTRTSTVLRTSEVKGSFKSQRWSSAWTSNEDRCKSSGSPNEQPTVSICFFHCGQLVNLAAGPC